MSSEGSFNDGVVKTRPALSDVTNLRAKRPFSTISGDEGDSRLAKQVCSGVENLVKKKFQSQFGVEAHCEKNKDKAAVLSQQKGKDTCFNLPSGSVEEEQNLLGGAVGSESNEDSVTGSGEIGQGRPSSEEFIDRGIESDERDFSVVENLGSPKCGGRAVELATTSASGADLLKPCSALKGNAAANLAAAGADLLKNCTCSFCSKAALMWSDLHYQDVKGRLSALKKSQKEASMVVKKFSEIKDTLVPDQQSSSESSKMELGLMHQWKSLFDFMEYTFSQESRQLESSFETLKDLRDNCKNDLEPTDNIHFDNP